NPFSDTWEWNGTSWQIAAMGGPGLRYGHRMAYDTVLHVTIMEGGDSPSTGMPQGDRWRWNGSGWSSITLSGGTAMAFFGMAYDVPAARTVLFGGFGAGNVLSGTTRFFDSATSSESIAATTGPSARAYVAMAYDSQRNRTVLFGGNDGA